MKQINPKQYYKSVEDMYNARLNYFIKLASRHVYNKDLAIDVVHDAFAKTLEYFKKHPENKVRPQIMEWWVLKCAKKTNRFSREIPSGYNFEENEEVTI